jgi:exodeoxyribonuclease VII large subunit
LSLPLFDTTYSVSDLCGEVRDFLREAFSSLWVAGEVQRLRPSRSGHLYFELVEKGRRDDIVGKLDTVIWRSDRHKIERALAATGQQIAEGQQIRCRGSIDFYPPAGRLQLVVREVDPVFTLGQLERRRQETLAALAAAGLLERNKALPLSPLPLAVGLVTSEGSAAYHDFLHALEASGYGFRVLFVHSAVQGVGAESQIASALATLAAAARGGTPLDAVALIRGGGSRTDLATFDYQQVAEAVARSPLPVLTGLGHQIDQSIADRVAHTALTTPTAVAEHLAERVAVAEAAVLELSAALRRAAELPLSRGRQALLAAEAALPLARLRLAATRGRLDERARALGAAGRSLLRRAAAGNSELARRLARGSQRAVTRRRGLPDELVRRLAAVARTRLRQAETALSGLARLTTDLSPQRTLERGFSITRTAAGAVVRRPAAVASGARLLTQTAGGEIASRVEEST